ncbi:hypothetical protein ACT3UQ_03045 [Glutamicibacter sp. AOP12-B1-11]|uniref:hypothetical protein n=1 Tax=Glutamicibacter sp. AOP12-B1-11 TaxID=3457725 RepID=UPI0040334A68
MSPEKDMTHGGPSRRSIVATLTSATALTLTGLGAGAAVAAPAKRGKNDKKASAAMSYRPSYHFSVPDN